MSQATEKLLHIIRSKGKEKSSAAHSSTRKVSGFRIPGPWSAKRRRLGVDIAPGGLRLMLVTDSESAPKILGFRDIPYPEKAKPGSADFPAFLRDQVKSLCGRIGDLQIWSHVFSFRAQLQRLLVPKAPPWELYDLVYWRVKRDNPFDDDEFLLDFKVQGQVTQQGASMYSVICCLVPRDELDRTRSYFIEAGLPLAGLTTASLALQTMFRKPLLPVDSPHFATLHVERDWSRIDIFSEGNLLMSRMVKTGMTSMAETLVRQCSNRLEDWQLAASEHGEDSEVDFFEQGLLVQDEAAEIAEIEAIAATLPGDDEKDDGSSLPKLAHVQPLERRDDLPTTEQSGETISMDQAMDMLIRALASGSDVASIPWESLSDDQIFNLITPVCERLAKQVERTISYNTREQNQERVELLMISGDLSVNVRVREVFWGILGMPAIALDPLDPDQHTKWGPTSPPTQMDRVRQNLSLALALCTSSNCLNLQKTFHQIEEARSVQRVNLGIYGLTILALLVMSLFYGMEHSSINERSNTLAQLDTRLAAFQPQVDEAMLMDLATRIGKEHARLGALSASMHPVAMLGEISRVTPDTIHLLNLRLSPAIRTGDDDTKKAEIILEALVTDPSGNLDSALTGYMFVLRRAGLFAMPVVQSQEREQRPGLGEVLRVVLLLDSSV
ncbi:hypothetical protein [Desulfonatronum sp. SC1]|uniref:hypothetical protein n=1 Tax=Desulfonatronum sp. SC1 TaxID=2109626 RepID=UPI000D302244|nr:hypothetical protein [Desulfonatronum sp. SC1]PTN37527.1 hypothetical protein C6366_06090 [Desulfonatronum sp. SC1]